MNRQKGIWKHLIIYSQLFFGMAFFGTGTPSARVVSNAFPLFMGPFLRLLFAALLLSPVLFFRRRQLRDMTRQDWLEVTIIGALGIVGFTLFLMTGMRRVSGVIGAIVMSLSPAVMAVAAVVFMKDSMGWRKITAVTIAVAGVFVINAYGKSINATGWDLLIGTFLVFAAVCSQTAYSLIGKRVMQNRSPAVVLSLAVWIAVLLFAVPGVIQARSFDFAGPTLNEWFGLALWGLGPLAVGTLLWFNGLHQVQASTASGFMGSMPAMGLLLSYFWLNEPFHRVHLLGFALVVTSIVLISWAHRVEERSAS